MKKLYDILNISIPTPITDDDIKKAYKKMAIKYHPDRGGDSEKFKELVKAYEILIDKEKREIYDKYGEEGLIIKEKKKCEPIVIKVEITLEQLYNGGFIMMDVNINKICKSCEGNGIDNNYNICEKCDGNKIIVEPKKFRITINNRLNGYALLHLGSGNEYPDWENGDIIFNIVEKEHAQFRKYGETSLLITKDIRLVDVLCGCAITIEHLDGRKIDVNVRGIDPIKVIGEGIVRNKGDLFIEINVIYPSPFPILSENDRTIVKKLFY